MKSINFRKVTKRSWIWLAIYTVALIAISFWSRSLVALILWPIFFDICITHFIPWRWWERWQSPVVRSFMRLLEDIVVVLLAVYMLNILFFQQFKIPTSSLEKTYLVGDYLFVSKLSYGPRLPFTPLSFPLVHNQFPWGGKAYLEKPQAKYRRLPGLGKVELGDIVVFNFPAGDTITTKVLNPDYYTLVALYGRERLWHDHPTFGTVQYRPVDMRDHYVKRAVALPGDTLQIVENELYLNGVLQKAPQHRQLNYFVQTNGATFTTHELEELGISPDDIILLDGSNAAYHDLFAYHLTLDTIPQLRGSYGAVYHFPLTEAMKQKLEKHSIVQNIVVEPTPDFKGYSTYPLNGNTGWTRDNYGPIWVPKKGATITLTPANLPIYERCIRNFEHHTLEVQGNQIVIDGTPTTTYTFQMDYYFMMGDNRHNSADSRAWGFVPEDHIVGKPLSVWLSIDKDKPLLKGGIRWNRIFTSPE